MATGKKRREKISLPLPGTAATIYERNIEPHRSPATPAGDAPSRVNLLGESENKGIELSAPGWQRPSLAPPSRKH